MKVTNLLQPFVAFSRGDRQNVLDFGANRIGGENVKELPVLSAWKLPRRVVSQ